MRGLSDWVDGEVIRSLEPSCAVTGGSAMSGASEPFSATAGVEGVCWRATCDGDLRVLPGGGCETAGVVCLPVRLDEA